MRETAFILNYCVQKSDLDSAFNAFVPPLINHISAQYNYIIIKVWLEPDTKERQLKLVEG